VLKRESEGNGLAQRRESRRRRQRACGRGGDLGEIAPISGARERQQSLISGLADAQGLPDNNGGMEKWPRAGFAAD
jgi:hypothetical protein